MTRWYHVVAAAAFTVAFAWFWGPTHDERVVGDYSAPVQRDIVQMPHGFETVGDVVYSTSSSHTDHSVRPNARVLWLAPFLSGGGYASEAISYSLGINSLDSLQYEFAIGQFAEQASREAYFRLTRREQKEMADLFRRGNSMTRRGAVVICHSTPDIWVPSAFSGWDEAQPCPPPEAGFRIGRTMYETDSVPKGWVERLNKMDQVWVPSPFHIDVFRAAGVTTPLVYIPQAVDTDLFKPNTGKQERRRDQPFRFLSVFKFERRKGFDILLKAFSKEFMSRQDDESQVLLVIKTSPFYTDVPIRKALEIHAQEEGLYIDWTKLELVTEDIDADQLADLYRSADAFVLPSRGEGWGRPHAEAMASGLALLATNFSGTTAFMNDMNAFPIKYTLQNAGMDSPELENHRWAEPDVHHLRETMRFVFSNPDQARKIGARARKTMETYFSLTSVAKIVNRQLEQILAGPGPSASVSSP